MTEEVKASPEDGWETYCQSCGTKYSLPRKRPPFGTALVCPKCKNPSQTVREDPPGCPSSWAPKTVELVFGYQECSIEHPRCPWCGKLNYMVVFPERGREVPWYSVEKQENPMSNYTIQVQCINCNRVFTIEWEGWPFSIESRAQCCFRGIVGIGDEGFMTIPEERRANFERYLGRKASSMAYLRDENNKPLWMACPRCLISALRASD